MDLIILKNIEYITARNGEFLQLRPKSFNSKARTAAIGKNGKIIMVKPMGFYLKKNFTFEIMKKNFSIL